MAVRDDVVLVSDGGEITVGRRAATYVYGNFAVHLTEGMEQEVRDDRLADGYVYRPDARPVGRFDVGFVRADATIDLEHQHSDLEAVLDDAVARVEGDTFFERDIGPAGLGRFEPDQDFLVGDVVDVELWGKRLRAPVTAVDYVSSEADGVSGWRVHVGGQVVADPVQLRRHNDERLLDVQRERRQRLRAVQQERQARELAISQEASARSLEVSRLDGRIDTADRSIEALTSEQRVLSSNHQALSTSLSSKVGASDFRTYKGNLHAHLWSTQSRINTVQSAYNTTQDAVNTWTRSAIDVLDRRIPFSYYAYRRPQALGSDTRVDDSDSLGRLWIDTANNVNFEKKFDDPADILFVARVDAISQYSMNQVISFGRGRRTGKVSVGTFEGVLDVSAVVFRKPSMPAALNTPSASGSRFVQSNLRNIR